MITVDNHESDILVVSENGYGKRSALKITASQIEVEKG